MMAVPAVVDLDDAAFVHSGTGVAIAYGYSGQRSISVQLGHLGGSFLNAAGGVGDFLTQS